MLRTLKFIIPVSCLLLLVAVKTTPLALWLSLDDPVIFMLCGLALVTGLELYPKNRSVGFFLISTSLLLFAMRLVLLFKVS